MNRQAMKDCEIKLKSDRKQNCFEKARLLRGGTLTLCQEPCTPNTCRSRATAVTGATDDESID